MNELDKKMEIKNLGNSMFLEILDLNLNLDVHSVNDILLRIGMFVGKFYAPFDEKMSRVLNLFIRQNCSKFVNNSENNFSIKSNHFEEVKKVIVACCYYLDIKEIKIEEIT